MFARKIRLFYVNLVKPLLLLISKLNISPNLLSLLGLIAIIISGYLFATANNVLGLGFLILGSLLDTLDGEYARLVGKESSLGGFFDSVCDHFGDFAVYLGLVWRFLENNQQLEIILAFIALFGSVYGSHIRSRAIITGIDLKNVGVFTRFERLALLILGIALNKMAISLLIIALVTNLSAIQRIKKVFDRATST